MYEIPDYLFQIIPTLMLIFARISAMFMVMPIIGYPMIAGRIRILLAFVISIILVGVLDPVSINQFETIFALAFALLKEVIIGLIIGFGSRILFESIAIAGKTVGMQMGLAIVNVMDPSSARQLPVISQFWNLVMLLFFLAANGHHFLINTVFINFQLIPLTEGGFNPSVGRTLVYSGSDIYTMAIKFAAPGMVMLMLIETGVGFTARMMPQLNIFFISMPLKIGVGLFILLVSINLFQVFFDVVYDGMSTLVSDLILQMRPT